MTLNQENQNLNIQKLLNHQNLSPQTIFFFDKEIKNDSLEITIDSPTRKQSRLNRIDRTTKFKTLSISKKIFQITQRGIWGQSATSIIRQKSPSFKFPKQERFSSAAKDQRKNMIILKLNIANEIKQSQKGISFARSQRKDHFKPKPQIEEYPSPASYYSTIFPEYQKLSKRQDMSQKPSTSCIFRTSKTAPKIPSNYLTSQFRKGITIPKSQKAQKLFLHHGRNLAYQPEVTINNPGVGKYNTNFGEKSILEKRFSLGKALKKFNEFVGSNPGPGSYVKNEQMQGIRCKSANFKGTMALSKRTYLVDKNPEEYSPGPDYYKLKRFLQN